jgi:hypothetical protein
MRRIPAALRVLRLRRRAFGITALAVPAKVGSSVASAAMAAEAATVANRAALTSNPGSTITVERAILSVPAGDISMLRRIATVARLPAEEEA